MNKLIIVALFACVMAVQSGILGKLGDKLSNVAKNDKYGPNKEVPFRPEVDEHTADKTKGESVETGEKTVGEEEQREKRQCCGCGYYNCNMTACANMTCGCGCGY